MTERLQVLEAQEEHAPLLAAFFRETWDPGSSAERVLGSWQLSATENPCEPGVAPPTYIAVQANRVLGYCSSLPLRLWSGSSEYPAYWAKGLMVLPEFRGGPIGFHVLSALTKSRPIMAAVTVADGSKRLFGALGYRDYGAIPNLVRPTRLSLLARQLRPMDLPRSSALVGGALRIAEWSRKLKVSVGFGYLADTAAAPLFARRSGPDLVTGMETPPPWGEVDALWQELQGNIGAAPLRDSLAWDGRYKTVGASAYHFVTLRRASRLVGIAVIRTPKQDGDSRLAGLRMASISDMLVHPEEKGVGLLLAAAEQHAASMGAGAVILSITNRRIVESARRRGYLERRGNIHFFLRDTAKRTIWPESLGGWWLTRGDGESDATF